MYIYYIIQHDARFGARNVPDKGVNLANTMTIRVISDACGILPQTLRAWEKRYNAFSPKRDSSGQRAYTRNDLKKAIALASLIKRGFTISQIATKSYSELESLLDEVHVDHEISQSHAFKNSGVELDSILQMVSDFRFDELVEELNRRRILLGVRDFLFKLSIPLVREVGLKVMNGDYSVTQEHIVSSIIRGQLNEMKSPLEMLSKSRGSLHRYALATPEGNFHELSILFADLVCGLNERLTSYLGAAHPADSLGLAVSAMSCDRIILGAIDSENWRFEKHIIPYLQKVDESLNKEVEFIIGGAWEISLPKFKYIKHVHFMESFEQLDKKLMQSIL